MKLRAIFTRRILADPARIRPTHTCQISENHCKPNKPGAVKIAKRKIAKRNLKGIVLSFRRRLHQRRATKDAGASKGIMKMGSLYVPEPGAPTK